MTSWVFRNITWRILRDLYEQEKIEFIGGGYMRPNNFCIFLLIVIFVGIPAFAVEDKTEEIIEFCDFKVPPFVAHANASFPVIYTMEINPNGVPININNVSTSTISKALSDEPFVECFQKWRLPPSYEKVEVNLYWKHAEGWISGSLSGKDFVRRWRFQKGWQVGIKKD